MRKTLLSLFSVICLLPHMAHAYNIETEIGGITYDIYYQENGIDEYSNCEISSASDELAGDIVIPSSIAYGGFNLPVVGINEEAFACKKNITSVTLPESIGYIGWGAFQQCHSLSSINIPANVTYIGSGAFSDCISLSEIDMRCNLDSIQPRTFEACISLDSIDIPSSVKKIGNTAFMGCEKLKKIVIPSLVTEIGERAFRGCENIFSIRIPASVTNIGDGAFSNCKQLIAINVDTVNKKYKSLDGVLFDKDLTTLIVCPPYAVNEQNYVIPASVKDIRPCAFNKCRMTSVIIPEGVSVIKNGTFEDCHDLINIDIPKSVNEIQREAFSQCHNLATVSIPEGVSVIPFHAFGNCNSLTSIDLPESLTLIEEKAFIFCSSLDSVKIPEAVTEIGQEAFRLCENLSSVSFPKSLVKLGISAFTQCKSLTELILPDDLHQIGRCAFTGCPSLHTVYLPANMWRLEGSILPMYNLEVFDSPNLKDIYYGADIPRVSVKSFFLDDSTYENATLYVKDESYDKILETVPWSLFKHIKIHDFSNSVVDIENDDDDLVEVYGINGVKIDRTVESLTPGLYVLRKGDEVKKIMVR